MVLVSFFVVSVEVELVSVVVELVLGEVPDAWLVVVSCVVLPEVLPVVEPLDCCVVVLCDVFAAASVVLDCGFALAPLVTVCEPLPTFTPGLTSVPRFTELLFTPTLASTPTFGFTESELLEVWSVELGVEEVELLLEDGLLLVLPEIAPEPLLDDAVLPEAETSADRSELELVDDGALVVVSSVVEDDDELALGVVAFRSTLLLMLVLDEEAGGDVLIDRSVPVVTPALMSLLMLLLPDVSGALGTHPAGVVFAVSMHFGSSFAGAL